MKIPVLVMIAINSYAVTDRATCLIQDLQCRTLLIRESPTDKFDLPGGTKEKASEQYKAAAAREVFEETGLRVRNLTHMFTTAASVTHACEVWDLSRFEPAEWDIYDAAFYDTSLFGPNDYKYDYVRRAIQEKACSSSRAGLHY